MAITNNLTIAIVDNFAQANKFTLIKFNCTKQLQLEGLRYFEIER